MNEKLLDKIKELEKKREVIFEQEAEKLLATGSDEETKSNLDRIENLSKLLDYKKNIISTKRYKRLIPALLLILSCTIVAGLLWSTTKSKITVSMKTVSSNVGFTLSQEWSLPETVTTDFLRIENFQALNNAELDLSFEDQSGNADLEVRGKDIVIESLTLEKGAIIEFDTASNRLYICIKQSQVKGAFTVKNMSSLSGKGIKDIEIKDKILPFPETIEFGGSGKSRVPINIIFIIKAVKTGNQLKFEGMKTNLINFLKEVPKEDQQFISTIKQGEVKLFDVPAEEKIYNGDVVKMDRINLRRLQISCNHDLHVFTEGEVQNLQIGPRGFERDMAPSLLEYIYHNQRFIFFLGVVASLLSALWGIKETIFK